MMRFLTVTLAFFAIPLTLTAADGAAVKKELKALEGGWKVVAGSEDGKEIPKDKLPRITYVLRADGTITAGTPDGETLATMTVDPTRTPKTLDFVLESGDAKGKGQYAIYKLEGDKLTIFITRQGGAAGDRPRDFTVKDAKARLLIFERLKGDK